MRSVGLSRRLLHAKHCADEVAEDVINMIESETFELPPELQTVMVEDNITWGDVSDAIQGSDFDMDGLDAMDYQNYLEDYDPDQDNVGLYIDNDRAWIDADKKECIVGARARLYEGFDVAKDTSENTSLQSEVWDPKPLDGASGLAPFLFLTQIPCSAPNADAKTASPLKTDEEFLRMFHRYGYSHFRRYVAPHQLVSPNRHGIPSVAARPGSHGSSRLQL